MKKYSIGGQALIEGVMMKGPKKIALAVRNASGRIVEEEWEYDSENKPVVFKIPIVRGIFNFIDSMKVGYKTLMRSADIAMEYDEDEFEIVISMIKRGVLKELESEKNA